MQTIEHRNLTCLVNALRSRATQRRLLSTLLTSVAALWTIFAFALVALLLELLTGWPLTGEWLITMMATLALVAGIVLVVRFVKSQPTIDALAQRADAAADAKNRFASAVEFSRHPQPTSLMQAAIADADALAARVEAGKAVPLGVSRGLFRFFFAMSIFILVVGALDGLLPFRAPRSLLRAGAADLSSLTQPEREKKAAEVKRELQQLTKDWQEEKLSSAQALRELQKLEAQLAQLSQQGEPRPAQVASQKAERAKQQENSGSENNDNTSDNPGDDTQPSNTRPPGAQQLQELSMMAADLRQAIESKQMQQPQLAQAPQQNQNRQNQQQQQQQQSGSSQQQQGQQQQQANQGQQGGQQPQSGNNASQRGSQSQQQGGQQTGGQPQQSGAQQGSQQSGSTPGQQGNQQGQQQGNQQGQQQGNQNGEQAGEGRPGQRGEQGKAPGKQGGQQPGKGSPSNQIGLGQSNPEEQEGKGTGAESEQKKPGGGSTNLIYVIPLPSSLRGQMGRGPAHTRTMKTDPSPANAMRPLTGQSPSASGSEADKLTSGRVPEQFKQNVREYFQPRKK